MGYGPNIGIVNGPANFHEKRATRTGQRGATPIDVNCGKLFEKRCSTRKARTWQ